MSDIIVRSRRAQVSAVYDELSRQPLFSTAFRHGGYVAGGFARFLTMHQDSIGLVDAYQGYLGPKHADIDLFFHDRDGYVKTFASLVDVDDSHLVKLRQMQTGNAINIQMRLTLAPSVIHEVNIQLIKCSFGPPPAIIGEFDFTNCRFAFDGENSYFDARAPDLEGRHVLDIARFRPESLLWRLNKYVSMHGYKRLTPESYRALIDFVFTQQDNPKTMQLVLTLIRAKVFEPDDVLLLSALFDEKRRHQLEASLNTGGSAGYDFFV